MVLIVEDNAAMRSLIRSLVEPLSVVHECASGEAALECYSRVHPDCVLMDIQLGEMDGISTTRAILAQHPDARVIIVTEHQEPEYRRAAETAGASGFVLKQNLLALPQLLAPLP